MILTVRILLMSNSTTEDINGSKIVNNFGSNYNAIHLSISTSSQNETLRIPGRQVVALICTSGCGKSTLAKLIADLYTSQSGDIQIGRYSIQDISLDCLR